MKSVEIIYHPKYLEHNPGEGHPERADRLRTVLKVLDEKNIKEKIELINLSSG